MRREPNLASLGPPTALPSAIPLHHSHLFFSPFPCGSTCPLRGPGRHNFADAEHFGRAGRKCLGRNFVDVGTTALIPIALVNDHHFWSLAPAEEQPAACLALNMERFEGNPLKMSVAVMEAMSWRMRIWNQHLDPQVSANCLSTKSDDDDDDDDDVDVLSS